MVGGAGLLRRNQKGCWGRKRLRNAAVKVTRKPEKNKQKKTEVGKVRVEQTSIGIAAVTPKR